jgi:hypothetical protein
VRTIYDLFALLILVPFLFILSNTRRRRDTIALFLALCALMIGVVAVINLLRTQL